MSHFPFKYLVKFQVAVQASQMHKRNNSAWLKDLHHNIIFTQKQNPKQYNWHSCTKCLNALKSCLALE